MKQAQEPIDAFSQFAAAILNLNDVLMRNANMSVAHLGMTSARWHVLGRLSKRPQTVSDIAREMGYARQSVQRTVNVLLAEGMLIASPNPGDKRAPHLSLTPHGWEVLGQVYDVQRLWSEKLTKDIGQEKLGLLRTDINEITKRLHR